MRIWTSLLFVLLNFAALGLGAYLMGDGVPSEWYQKLSKAPWTPPGWVFGAAWTFIMICFGVFMGWAWFKVNSQKLLILLYGFQWMLNVFWNPVFFDFHWVLFGLIVIILLWGLMLIFVLKYQRELGWIVLLIYPYIIWLAIATSLNAYVFLYN